MAPKQKRYTPCLKCSERSMRCMHNRWTQSTAADYQPGGTLSKTTQAATSASDPADLQRVDQLSGAQTNPQQDLTSFAGLRAHLDADANIRTPKKPKRKDSPKEDPKAPPDTSEPKTPANLESRPWETSCATCNQRNIRCTHAPPIVPEPYASRSPSDDSPRTSPRTACENCQRWKQKCTHSPPFAPESETPEQSSSDLVPDAAQALAQLLSSYTRTPAALPPAPQHDEASLASRPALQYDVPTLANGGDCVLYQRYVGDDEMLNRHYHAEHYWDRVPYCTCYECNLRQYLGGGV